MAAIIELDFESYPNLRSLVRGQRTKLEMGVEVLSINPVTARVQVRSLREVGRGKMSTQEIVQNQILDRVEAIAKNQSQQSTRV